jgi:ABC-type uncharacterized transport system ATPase subunit
MTVSFQNITKRFPGGIVANKDVSLQATGGEIQAILGENGAGKTTLMRILAGFYQPDSGQIHIDGRQVHFHSPKDAKLAGVGMVHQHFSLVPALTVAENLALSAAGTPFFLTPKRWGDHLTESAQRLGMKIRPNERVSQLSMGERQRVEIFRLILEGARILILDEPTSILAPQEAKHLFDHLRLFTDSGHVVLLVTHKIDHVRAVADRVTVLRRGSVVAASKTEELTERQLAELMVDGRFEVRSTENPARRKPGGREVLEVRHLTVKPLVSPSGLSNLSFTLRSGEILGVAGISGNGQDELVAALTGTVKYEGAIDAQRDGLNNNVENGLAYIPGDRMGVGVALSLSLRDNLCLRDYSRPPFSSGPFLRPSQLQSSARQKIAAFGIRPDAPSGRTAQLSGGNIQKVILARELAHRPNLIVAVSPTAGLDLAAVEFVHRQLSLHANDGTGVLMVSEDLDELLSFCDRILVLFAGRFMGIVDAAPERRNDIGLMMSGFKVSEVRSAGESVMAEQ